MSADVVAVACIDRIRVNGVPTHNKRRNLDTCLFVFQFPEHFRVPFQFPTPTLADRLDCFYRLNQADTLA